MKYCNRKHSETIVKVFSHHKDLPKEWNNFIPEDHFLHSQNLAVTEQIALPNISFLYLLSYNGETPVFAAGFQVLALRPEHINHAMVKPLQHFAWAAFSKTIRPKLLVSGHLFRHDVRSIYCNTQIAEFDEYKLYKQALDKALHISCASAILLKDMPERLAKYFQNFAPQYIQLRNDISMEMDIDSSWTDIHSYEKALKHKYAQRFRKVRKPWEQLQIKEFTTEDTEQHKDKIFDLYKQVTNHQQVRIGLLNADFMPVLKRAHNERLKVWGIYENEKLIGFFSAWLEADAFDMFYIGFEYEKNRTLNLYFNILFFSIEQAIKFNKQKLILGRTALDAKARLGCTPNYLSTFLYIRNSLVRNRVMQTQKNTSEKEGAWESRHPFKAKQN